MIMLEEKKPASATRTALLKVIPPANFITDRKIFVQTPESLSRNTFMISISMTSKLFHSKHNGSV